ncbi:MAG TPA: glycoside hydrolase family 44 protein, partial [Tepidisphaeraceae bacterium]|nr:glycoside hydrolase family 44 protein [Tepidisphaeraceae bacterium]
MTNRKFALLGLLLGNLICIGSSFGAGNESADVTIDIHADQAIGKISPYVYGINSADWEKTPHVTFTRQGGNRMTAWNWENNASNAGKDWRNQSDDYLGGGDKPGEVVRSFLAPAMQRGKAAIITVPMAGYVAADKNPPNDVNQTPDFLQKRFEPVLPKKNAPFEFPPNLKDHAVYDDEMVWWINKEFPESARHGGQIFYDLDNEPDIWQESHSRIHPEHVTYAEMVQRTRDYAGGIKDVVKDAVIFGFVSYGYNGYKSLQDAPDGDGRYFIDFFLDSMKDVEKQQNRRL